jgi:XTP/dITP diphosphohydrolase
LRKSRIWMATGNENKVREAAEVLAEYGVELSHLKTERVEVQADDLDEIAAYSLRWIGGDKPVVVEDAGLFVDHLGGFPGPYSSYVLKRLGNPGILKLMEGVVERSARYLSAVAYKDEGGVRVFHGAVEGRIAESIRGSHGFGYDPIFIPAEGDGHTFGEMSDEEKNKLSHRARAFRALGGWLAED